MKDILVKRVYIKNTLRDHPDILQVGSYTYHFLKKFVSQVNSIYLAFFLYKIY